MGLTSSDRSRVSATLPDPIAITRRAPGRAACGAGGGARARAGGVRVSDDGAGGARVQAGGGLAELAERVKTVDGRLQVSSPPAGPTVVTVELPSHA
jgi:hypothetical protein